MIISVHWQGAYKQKCVKQTSLNKGWVYCTLDCLSSILLRVIFL